MKNLFSRENLNNYIAKYSKLKVPIDLIERVYTSRLLGSDPNLVLHGGGNTSVKSTWKDIDGEIHKIIYVKGSGWDLSNIEPNGFPGIKINPLMKILNKKTVTDEEMVNFTRKNLINNSSPNPSVESLVHAIISEKFVDHTHSNSILEITNQSKGMQLTKSLFGKNFIIIPYVMPGYLLAKKVNEMYNKDNPNIHGLILFRHGIFTFANTAEESYARMINAVNKAQRYLKKCKVKNLKKISIKKLIISSAEMSPLLKSNLGIHKDYILNFQTDSKILSLINKKNIELYLRKGPITPDHVIRTKPKPLVINIDKCKNLEQVRKVLKEKFLNFSAEYIKYFNLNKSKKNNVKILDTIPHIIIIPNMGIFSVGNTLGESKISGDISRMSIETILRIEERSKFESINEKDIFNVEYWSLEQAKLNKPKKEMQGKIVLITGGAGTIGYASAEKFKKNGAEVIIIDKDKDKIDKINKQYFFKSYCCDVTNRKSVKKIFSDICLIYGGIDIVISNAGAAIEKPIADINDSDLKKSFEINFFSHQIIASESIKIMITQKKGGCLLFNISKQAVNPGKNFGAYGTSKSALLALCKQYALEYGQFGIRSNGVNADRIKSGLLNKKMIFKRSRSRNISENEYLKGNLLRQEVTAEDVATAFYSLSISKKTTASVLTVDGGNIEASLR